MSTVLLGANAKLMLGLAANAKVDITQPGLGTGDIARNRTYDSRPVPGARGRGGSQPGKFYSDALSFPMDFNAVTSPVLRAAQAQRLYYTLQPQGTNAGQEVGEAVCSAWTKTWDIPSDSVSGSVTLMFDGAPASA